MKQSVVCRLVSIVTKPITAPTKGTSVSTCLSLTMATSDTFVSSSYSDFKFLRRLYTNPAIDIDNVIRSSMVACLIVSNKFKHNCIITKPVGRSRRAADIIFTPPPGMGQRVTDGLTEI